MMKRNDDLEAERKAFRNDPNYNWADFQEVVQLCGGDDLSPAVRWIPRSPGDNMGWHGFRRAEEFMVFSVLDDEFKLPSFAGVYAVTAVYHGRLDEHNLTVGFLHLLYIGSSQDIAKRLSNKNHWYNRFKSREPQDVRVELWIIQTPDHRRIERDLIRRMRPLLNIQYRNGRS